MFDYPNKQAVCDIFSETNQIQPIKYDKNKSWLYYGDNFNILSGLLHTESGFIDLIYIDPPFSTSNTFYISDREHIRTISAPKSDSVVAYSDNFSHYDYFNFLRKRLIIMRELLSDQGSLYLHIDYKIGHYIKILLDEIFGVNCFKNDITRIKSNPKNFSRKAYGNVKDLILFYVKNHKNYIWNEIKKPLDEDTKKQRFKKTDAQGRKYTTVPCHAPGETINGNTGGLWRGMPPPKGRHWRVSPKELDKLEEQGMIEWSKTGNPRIKKYANEHLGTKIQDIWTEYKDPQYPLYPTHKNENMLDLIVKQSSAENSIILDSFAGSGGLLQAAFNNNRKFIGIDNSSQAINVIKKRNLGSYEFAAY